MYIYKKKTTTNKHKIINKMRLILHEEIARSKTDTIKNTSYKNLSP